MLVHIYIDKVLQIRFEINILNNQSILFFFNFKHIDFEPLLDQRRSPKYFYFNYVDNRVMYVFFFSIKAW